MTKPFDIPKKLVWEAYRVLSASVCDNRGLSL